MMPSAGLRIAARRLLPIRAILSASAAALIGLARASFLLGLTCLVIARAFVAALPILAFALAALAWAVPSEGPRLLRAPRLGILLLGLRSMGLSFRPGLGLAPIPSALRAALLGLLLPGFAALRRLARLRLLAFGQSLDARGLIGGGLARGFLEEAALTCGILAAAARSAATSRPLGLAFAIRGIGPNGISPAWGLSASGRAHLGLPGVGVHVRLDPRFVGP